MVRTRRQISSQNARKGGGAEQIFTNLLLFMGAVKAEKIETGFRWVQGKAIPGRKVSGDIRGLIPGGRAIHVECKSTKPRLHFSAFKPHQIANLDLYAEHGALTLVGWHWTTGYALIDWSEHRLRRGESWTIEQAVEWDIYEQRLWVK